MEASIWSSLIAIENSNLDIFYVLLDRYFKHQLYYLSFFNISIYLFEVDFQKSTKNKLKNNFILIIY